MKNIILVISFLLSLNSFGESLKLERSTLDVGTGPFWFQKWTQNQHEGISLHSVNSFDAAFLLTFSGSDFTYLNQQNATELKQINESTVMWKFSDSQVDYTRTYETKGDYVLVSVNVDFKAKAPEKAFVSLVSRGPNDDPEEQDREVIYYTNAEIERNKVSDTIDPTEVTTPIKWMGSANRYFVLTLIPTDSEKLLLQSTGEKTAQASLQMPVKENKLAASFKVAFLPKELNALRKVEPSLDTTVNLGFFTFVAYPLLWLLKWIHQYVHNYGIAIIILTIIIKILLFPLTLKSVKGMRKMADFQPKIKALQEKYKDDKARLNQEMMTLMKTSGYNPLSGCMPILFQMPIFFALYSVLYAAVELYRAPFAFWIVDLSARDPYFITPILMTGLMFLQTKLTPPSPGMDPTQQKIMQYMPLMFGAFMLATPAGLCVYMLVNAAMSILQQIYLNKKLGVPGHAAGIASL